MPYYECEDGSILLSYTISYPDRQCPCKGSRCSSCKKTALIKQKIEQKIAEMEVLMHELQDIKEESNQAHCRIIQVLPVEITMKIFDLYVNWDRDEEEFCHIRRNRRPLSLGAVCKEWRGIAWNIPQLWTNIDIRVDGDNPDKNLDLLCDWLPRSGLFSLSIRLLSNSSRAGEEYNHEVSSHRFGPLADVIAQCSHRWKRLTMKVDMHFALYLFGVVQDVSYLDELKIEMPDEVPRDLAYFNLFRNVIPGPRCVDIGSGLTFPHVNIDWTRVTHCKIFTLDSQSFSALLEGCPSLESYTVSRFSEGPDSEILDWPLTPSPPVTHCSLRYLSIPFGHSPKDELTSLCQAVFPHLYELEINLLGEIDSEAIHFLIDICSLIFPNSPHKVTLAFQDDLTAEDTQTQLLTAFPNIIHLQVIVHDARVTALPINLSQNGIHTSSEPLLSLLEVMELEMKWASKDDLDTLINIFDPLLIQHPLKVLKLRTEPPQEIEEQESIIDRLLELKDEGVEVEWISYDGMTTLLHTNV